MANKNLPITPQHAPGDKVAEVLKRIPQIVRADRLDAGDFAGDTTIELFNVPADTMIVEVMCNISEAFTGSTTIGIGDGGSTSRFMDTTVVAPTVAAGTSSKQDLSVGSGMHHYVAADTIDLILSGATPTAGTIDVYIAYILNHNRNLIVVP